MGTTATADARRAGSGYRGRFAPSPTGRLHAGSLFAAVGSWLDAKRHDGAWLLRHEDLDTPRVVPGAETEIDACLRRIGLVPDEPPVRQSSRIPAYDLAFADLLSRGLLYPCRCSRSDVGPGPYPGTCRDTAVDPRANVAWRLRLPDAPLTFTDRLQGPQSVAPAAIGDPVIRRRDGIYAYQFAVVIDDAWQRITDVVRGADLLDSTPWQLAIAAALGLDPPRYLHLPVLVEPDGSKLAKSRHSVAIDTLDPEGVLASVLGLLCPGASMRGLEVPSLLAAGICNFDPARLEVGRKLLIFKDGLG